MGLFLRPAQGQAHIDNHLVQPVIEPLTDVIQGTGNAEYVTQPILVKYPIQVNFGLGCNIISDTCNKEAMTSHIIIIILMILNVRQVIICKAVQVYIPFSIWGAQRAGWSQQILDEFVAWQV